MIKTHQIISQKADCKGGGNAYGHPDGKISAFFTPFLSKTAHQNIACITAKLDQFLGVCGDHGCVVLVREQGEGGELQELLQEL